MPKRPLSDIGVTSESTIYAHIPSPFAKAALFYLIFSGHYFCNTKYCIERPYVDMFLLMYVRRGSLYCSFGQREWHAQPGQVILMDCKQHHIYRAAAETTEFQWFHFSGVGAQAYYDYLAQRKLLLSSPSSESTTIHINSLIQMMEQPVLQEQTASILIHSILRNISEQSDENSVKTDPAITWAATYIHEHYADNITVDALADLANVSKFHFIRSFKRIMGNTPHEYLVHLRVKRSMEMLTNTGISIEEVAARCGFSSASHYSRCFRNVMGTSPSEFRMLYSTGAYGHW